MEVAFRMTYDPELAAVLRKRLVVGQLLDDSAALSLMERASFRLELLDIATKLDQHEHSMAGDYERLSSLHHRVLNRVASAT